MKKLKIALFTLCAAALFAAPAIVRAQDNTNAAASTQPKMKKLGVMPFKGNLAAVDTGAMTLTVGTRTFTVTSETKITKDGQPATLADGVVGQPVSGAYKKSDDGTLTATTIHFGAKAKKKKAAADAGNGQN